MPEVTIRHRAFAYSVEVADGVTREVLARRGETVNVSDEDYARGLETGAFVPDADDPQNSELDLATASIQELAEWISEDKPKVQEVVDAAEGDADVASRLLDAENLVTGNQPRAGVLKGLTAVISGESEDDGDDD